MRRHRNVKIVATLGPASNDYQTIKALFEAGADVLVAGSATFKGGPDQYAANIAGLKGDN